MSMPAPSYSSNGPMTAADCEILAGQLLDPGLAIRRKLEIAAELRDSAESTRDFASYEKYLFIFVPALLHILGDEKTVSFVKDHADQRYRHTLLSFLQRLPHNDPFRQHEANVMDLMVRLLRVENEENALLCIKVMIDGFRSHKVCHHRQRWLTHSLQDQAEPYVEPFLELVKQMYANTKSVVEKEFGSVGAMRPPVSSLPTH